MRLHVLGLPHTQVTREYLHCAYTQKVLKFCDMMTAEGHDLVLYAGDECEATVAEHVPLYTEAERRRFYGEWDPTDALSEFSWDPEHRGWWRMNERAVAAMKDRVEPGDLILPVAGWSQHDAWGEFKENRVCEWAVGYEGITAPFCVFESYAWMHHVYGIKGMRNGRFFDAVIPNFFDPADFDLDEPQERADWLLYMGRLVGRKGLHAAVDIAKRTGRKLVMAGPGATAWGSCAEDGYDESGWIEGPDFGRIEGPIVFAGPADTERRAQLMRRAAAILVPTLYVEPFGGVACEAAICGTPVVATDWGAFTETITPEIGRRFRTLGEAATAVEEAVQLDPDLIREHALSRWSLEAVGPQFTRHFERLASLDGKGWYA